MKKLSIKDVIEFRKKSNRSKQTFVSNLRYGEDKKNPDRGGDYWISAVSAINNCYKYKNIQYIIDKRNELVGKYEIAEYRNTKIMYKKNIELLSVGEELDFDKWRPIGEMKYMKKYNDYSILNIEGFHVKVSPSHIFTFNEDGVEKIGAIWFIAKQFGYSKEELGMFADILYRYLTFYYCETYSISSQYCIAVDVFRGFDINYLQLQEGEISQILSSTIDEIKAAMNFN